MNRRENLVFWEMVYGDLQDIEEIMDNILEAETDE